MKLSIYTPLSAALTILVAGTVAPLSAQEYGRQDPQQRRGQQDEEQGRKSTAPRHIALDDMLSAEVVLKSDAVSTGNARGDEARPRGEVEDLIIDLATGETHWAVLGVGGLLDIDDKPVAVPMNAMRCEQRGKDKVRITLDVTPENLKRLPAFPIDEAREKGLAATMRTVEASWTAVVEEGEEADEDAGGGAEQGDAEVVARGAVMAAKPVKQLCATQFDDWKVRTADGSFGNISSTYVNIGDKPKVHYVIVSSGGIAGIGSTEYLVPFKALNVTQSDGDTWAWSLPKTSAEMEKAPEFEAPENGKLNEEQCRKAAEFFGVEHTEHHGKGKAKEKGAKRGDGDGNQSGVERRRRR